MVKGLDGKSGYQVQFHIISIKEDKEEEEEPKQTHTCNIAEMKLFTN